VSVLVIGVDPGTVKMGVGVIRLDGKRMEFVRGELLEAPARLPLCERLAELQEDLRSLLDQVWRDVLPEDRTVRWLAAVEEGYGRRQTDLTLAESRGIARAMLSLRVGPDVRGYAPSTVKKAVTGNGGSTKDSVAFAVKHTLRMKVAPQADIADALAVAITRAMDKE
jgi:crossover junction endodeoxyribonuclease RuvC